MHQLVHTKNHTPRVIPVSHKLNRLGEKSVALVVRDGAFKTQLTVPETEEVFNEIITFTRLKSVAKNRRAAVRFLKENDVLVADSGIYGKLPETLGAQFYVKNKRVPFKVLMSEPTPAKPTHNIHDQCEPKYVRAQVKSILGNTSFVPPAGGTCVSIVVGYTDWKVSELLTNINDVVEYLTNEAHAPNGGLLRSVTNLHSVLVRIPDSVALPVMPKKEVVESDTDLDT